MNAPVVYVIDDNVDVLAGLKSLLESVNLTVYTYKNPQTFLDEMNDRPTGCVLLDVRMPHLSGMVVLERIVSKHPKLAVIMLSGYGDIPMAVKAIKLGAVDFVAKPFKDQALLDLVQSTLGKLKAIDQLDSSTDVTKLYGLLTPREREILHCIVEGKLNKQIASELGIAISTVEMHRSNIMEKMKSENIVQLIKKYLMLNQLYLEANAT